MSAETRPGLRVERVDSLQQIPATDWDALDRRGNPFLSHDFLAGLESCHCLDNHGWMPVHLVVMQGSSLLAALPLYLRDNSFGEFVFDWSWADAHEQNIGPYYPKLVSAIPFTPVSGPRLLIHPDAPDPERLRRLLIDTAIRYANDERLSSLHCLFPDESDRDHLVASGLLVRGGCEYQWFNNNYTDFDDFLAVLTSKRRKEIRRERQSVRDSGLAIDVLRGTEITAEHWEIFHDFYCSTFERKWSRPRLTLEFFRQLSDSMTAPPLLIMARDSQTYVAGAFALVGDDTLYGRHWGCSRGFRNLHFELCYYQTLEFCIKNRLQRLDAGVQGEHKLSRGFIPVPTWSCHWLRHPGFRAAVSDFVEREQALIDETITTLRENTAYKCGTWSP